MPSVVVELDALACQIATGLELRGVPYALGGALALAYAGEPRGTRDIDINLWVPMDSARDALAALAEVGVEIDVEAAARQAAERGDARGAIQGVRVDIFLNSIPLHDAAMTRCRRVELLGTPVWVLSAEDIMVLKLLFNRPKDRVDVERVMAIRRHELDLAYLRGQLVAHVEEDDDRVGFLDELTTRWLGD